MIDSKFDWKNLHRKMNSLHNQIQDGHEIAAATNNVKLAHKMKEFDLQFNYVNSLREEHEANPTYMIQYVEKSILAIFSLYQIYKIVQYYKISTPAQNVNNLIKNKGGRNVATKVKKPPQKSTIGKR